jgi:hypothetical protein
VLKIPFLTTKIDKSADCAGSKGDHLITGLRFSSFLGPRNRKTHFFQRISAGSKFSHPEWQNSAETQGAQKKRPVEDMPPIRLGSWAPEPSFLVVLELDSK